jgi:phosphopantetheinyl transferase
VLRQTCPRCGAEGHGPPRVVDLPVSVSWSHSSGQVAVAASSSHRVGLDVEVVGRIALTPELLQTALAPAEVDHVTAAADPQGEFLRLWTQKEALVKLGSDLDAMVALPLADLAARVGALEWRSASVGPVVLGIAVAQG